MFKLRRLDALVCLVGGFAFLATADSGYAQFRIFRRSNINNIVPNNAQTDRDIRRTDASNAYQKRDYDKTLEITGALLATDPNDFVALHLQAASRIEMGLDQDSNRKIRDGVEDARRSVGIAGDKYAWLYVPYMYGLSSLAALEGRQEHADLALKVVEPVLSRSGLSRNDRGSLLYQRGLCYLAKENLQSAIDDFGETIKYSPDLQSAYMRRAELLSETKQIKPATEAFDKLVSTFPNLQLAYNYRGKFRYEQRNMEGAISDFSAAIRLQENDSDYVNRGMCLLETNEPLAAEGDFSHAMKLNPKNELAIRFRGSARVAHGDLDEALKDFEAGLKLMPNDQVAIEERGFAKYFKKDYAGAAADLDKVLAANPAAFRLAQWLYLSYLRSGKTAEAKQLLETKLKGKIPENTWQAKVCSYLQDRLTEKELLAAAKDTDARYQASKLCEANFFIAEKKAVAGAAEEAKAHYLEAEKQETAFPLAAFRGAKYELKSFAK